MLSLHLAPIFKARNIERPFTFLVKAGFSRHAATSILSASPRIFRLDHIEMLCKILVCEPNDLLVFTPESGHNYAENFPLLKLKKAEMNEDLKATLATMPLKQLKEVTKAVLDGIEINK
jgi:hypothetical protein